MLLQLFITLITGVFALILGTLIVLRIYLVRDRDKHRQHILQQANVSNSRSTLIVGFFHPYCNAGGGGERVLWTAIEALLRQYPNVICVLYTGDTQVSKQEMLDKTKSRFDITLPEERLVLVYLYERDWVEDKRYPRFTLLGQSIGSMLLGWEALRCVIPDIFIDSMGYAFTFPLARLAGCHKVAAYVHYPTISTDMIEKVSQRTEDFNNNAHVAASTALSSGKLLYYQIFATIYGWVGALAKVVMVNSSWTRGHIEQIWGLTAQTVYPPCDTIALNKLPLTNRSRTIMSIGQFRPEKDHALQVKAFKQLLVLDPSLKDGPDPARLVLLGSCRHAEDAARIDALKELADKLDIKDNVEFVVNAAYDVLLDRLSNAMIGIHTMWNEHFGIGVVEYMAAGLVPVAHNSAGPRMDIVVPHQGQRTGYLAHDEHSFAQAMLTVLNMPEEERLKVQQNARDASQRFSAESFCQGFLQALEPLLN
ncbi:mannosyltransferase [Syncephalis plumigaleata]|nr:mannosyltransferase [Syncephalis plumigaleata]